MAAAGLLGYAIGQRHQAPSPAVAQATPALSPLPAAQPPPSAPVAAPAETTPPTAPIPPASPAVTASAPAVETPDPTATRDLLAKALAIHDGEKLAETRDSLRTLLPKLSDPQQIADVQKALGDINIQLLMTLAPAPERVDYVVEPGDSLARIAKQYNTTIEVIRKANNLRESVIQPAQRLRITPLKLAVSVDRTKNTMVVTNDGKFFKLYRVGTGQYGTTPTGNFKITDRIPNPPWWKDGQSIPFGAKENILGKYWLSLDIPHYGIHGTWDPESIGHSSSQGCVRLLNEDVEELFNILPVGTPVQITD